ncbi:MAG: hypothetical protein DRJ05_13555 [Bacteroidetes bacterium]|nr:MAG: hypothetical protein DRJ05_13555 [Bacteroidota bacterium]
MKRILTIAVVAMLTVVLISCGGSDSGSSTNDNESKKSAKMTANIDNGKVVYEKICIACHMTGVAGAAALTDKPRWEEMAAKGMKTLHNSVISGIPEGKYGVMPEKGSCVDCSDQDLYDAVSYMLKEAGVTAN